MQYKQIALSHLCSFRNEKTEVNSLSRDRYVSTENMLSEKRGVEWTSSLPSVAVTSTYRQDDVLVSNIRPYFKKIWKATCSGGCSNDVLVFTPHEGVNPTFLYYVLSQDDFFAYATKTAKGTKMPRGDKKAIMDFIVPLIPLAQQRKIAAVLSSLDDKIETNNAICRNLEEQMEALYGAFVGKKAWKKANIGELVERVAMGPFGSNIKVSTFVDEGVPIISGNHLRGKFVEDCDFNFITESHAQKLNRSLVHAGDIVFTHAGTLGQVAMVPDDTDYGEYIISQRQFFLRCNQEKALPLFVLLFFHSKWGQWQLLSYANQTGVPSIAQPATNLKKIEIPLPPINAQKEWAKCVQPLVDEFRVLWQQKRRLAALRDTLLPRLMSGELDVSAVNLR